MWHFKNKVIYKLEDFPQNCIGFVYKITNLNNGKWYIGKKNLYFERTKKLGKKELANLEVKRGKKPSKKKVITESDWMIYYGSEPVLKQDVKSLGEACFQREILELCFNKKHLTYCEVKWQILENALESELSYNSNILGKFFKKDMI